MGEIDQGDAPIDEATMRAVHLPPFKAAIEAGAMAIMVSYSSINGAKMSASSHWLTDVVASLLLGTGWAALWFGVLAPSQRTLRPRTPVSPARDP